MARVQAQYSPQDTGLQRVTARPVQAVQARFDTPQESSAARLARALGAIDPNQLAGSLDRLREVEERQARREAEKFANSITLDELGKRIKSGEMLPSQSPVFAATVQHIYAENSQKQIERDVLSGIASGELKFSTPGELEQHLVDRRNEFLEGQSDYVVAGFDKGWESFRERALSTNLQVNDKEAVSRGVQEATDNLSNGLLEVTHPTYTGTVDDAATALMDRYELLTGTQVLREDARKEALTNLMLRIAVSGNQELLNAMLKRKLPNNGPTLAAFLGTKSVSLANTAESSFDQEQRLQVDAALAPFYRQAASGELDEKSFEALRAANEKYISSATYESILRSNEASKDRIAREQAQHANIMEAQRRIGEASQAADALIAEGRGYQVQAIQVPTPDGGTKTIKREDIILDGIERRLAAEPDMSFTDQIRLYAQGDVENEVWKQDLTAAVNNIAEVGVDANGKPLGELLPATKEALDRFAIINQTNAYYAKRLAGGDDKYQVLSNIQALRESGVPDVNLAASLVNQAENNTAKNIETIKAQVQSAVNELSNPSWFSGRHWAELLQGEWGEGDKNVRPMANALSSLAKVYMAADIVTSGEAAVEMALRYYSDPSVTTQVNNTVYLNKDLPKVPERQSQREWMQRFLDFEVADYLKSQGIEYDKDEVYLHPMKGGEGRFMLHLNGTPIGKQFTRSEIEQWIIAQNDRDMFEAAEKRKAVPNPDAFLQGETEGGASLLFRKP